MGSTPHQPQECRPAIVHAPDRRIVTALAATSFEEVLPALALQTRLYIGAHQSAISYIPHGDFHTAVHAHSFSEKYEKYNTYDVMPTGQGIWGLVVKQNKAVCMTDAEVHAQPLWKHFSGLKDARGLEHPPMRGWLAVPVLRPNADILGVLQLSDKFDDAEFSAEDLDKLKQLAQMVFPTFELQYVNEQLENRSAELYQQRIAALNLAQDAEDARRQAEKAREMAEHAAKALALSNTDLEQFAYAASHDLQEPLRAVTGYCQLLQRTYQSKLDEKGNEYINNTVEGAQRMSSLIQDLLEFARVTRKGEPFQQTDFNAVIQQAQARLKVAIEECGARVEYGTLPTLRADKGQLIRLFQNLIGNALKFRGPQLPDVRIAAEETTDEWVFSVRDNGIGIEPRYQERIFVIFQRLHTREEYPGTGIGLAVCKRIVERHSGRIWVESTLGQGSTFFFTLAKRLGEPT